MRIIVELVNTMFKKRQKKIDQSRRTENVHRRVKSVHFYPTHDFLCTPLTVWRAGVLYNRSKRRSGNTDKTITELKYQKLLQKIEEYRYDD